MALVWDYGERTGLQGWKGLSWGMVSVNLDKMMIYLLMKFVLDNVNFRTPSVP